MTSKLTIITHFSDRPCGRLYGMSVLSRSNFINAVRQCLLNGSYRLLDPEIDRTKVRLFNIISTFDLLGGTIDQPTTIENWGIASSVPIAHAVELYINNEGLFRKFFSHFKDESKHMIAAGIKQQAFYHTGTLCLSEPQHNILDLKYLRVIHLKKLHITHNNVGLFLSNRQMQCLFYMSKGYSLKEIARLLNLSPKSIECYINKIKEKTKCRHKLELITIANKNFVNQWVI